MRIIHLVSHTSERKMKKEGHAWIQIERILALWHVTTQWLNHTLIIFQPKWPSWSEAKRSLDRLLDRLKWPIYSNSPCHVPKLHYNDLPSWYLAISTCITPRPFLNLESSTLYLIICLSKVVTIESSFLYFALHYFLMLICSNGLNILKCEMSELLQIFTNSDQQAHLKSPKT